MRPLRHARQAVVATAIRHARDYVNATKTGKLNGMHRSQKNNSIFTCAPYSASRRFRRCRSKRCRPRTAPGRGRKRHRAAVRGGTNRRPCSRPTACRCAWRPRPRQTLKRAGARRARVALFSERNDGLQLVSGYAAFGEQARERLAAVVARSDVRAAAVVSSALHHSEKVRRLNPVGERALVALGSKRFKAVELANALGTTFLSSLARHRCVGRPNLMRFACSPTMVPISIRHTHRVAKWR